MSVSPFVNKAGCVSRGNNAEGTRELQLNGPRWKIPGHTNGRFSRMNELRVLRNFATNCTSKGACPSGHVTLKSAFREVWNYCRKS